MRVDEILERMARVIEAQQWQERFNAPSHMDNFDSWPCGCSDHWHAKTDGVYSCQKVNA